MGDGAEYGQEEAYEAASVELEIDIEDMKLRYQQAYEAKKGSTIICPTCNSKHKKTTYHKVFDTSKCKDQYWNLVVDKRRERAKQFSE